MIFPRGNVAAVHPVLHGSPEFPAFRITSGQRYFINTVLPCRDGYGLAAFLKIGGIRRSENQFLLLNGACQWFVAHGGGMVSIITRGLEGGAGYLQIQRQIPSGVRLAVQTHGNQPQIQRRTLAADGGNILHAHEYGGGIPRGIARSLDQLLIPVGNGSGQYQFPDARKSLPVQGKLHGILPVRVQNSGLLLHS